MEHISRTEENRGRIETRTAYVAWDITWLDDRVHWLLDVHFNEDKTRVSDMNVQKSLNFMRKIALNLVCHFKANNNTKFPISGILERNLFDLGNLSAFLASFKLD